MFIKPSIARFQTYQGGAYPDHVALFDDDDYISRHVLNGHEWEKWLCDEMASRYVPGTDIIEVGANMGLLACSLARRIPITGTIHLFEPQPDAFLLMQYNTRNIGNKALYNMCLWDRPQMMYFTQNYINVGATVITSCGDRDPHPEYPKIYVNATYLDSIPFINKVSLMKLDVEGAELKVLQGARQLIAQHMPTLAIEMVEGCNPVLDTTLKDFGYKHVANDEKNMIWEKR